MNLQPIESEQAWTGVEMAEHPEQWIYELSDADVAELTGRASALVAEGRSMLELTPEDFPFPGFSSRLVEIRRAALHGRGFALVRGLPVEALTVEELAMTFWGVGLHLGSALSQNAKGHVLGHVKDLGLDYDHPQNRGYQTSAKLPFHTDYSDLVALLCVRRAHNGGVSRLASSVTIFNEMVRSAPDLAAVLCEPVYRTRWGEVDPSRDPWIEVPVFNVHESGVTTTYVRSAVRKAQLMPEVPRLSERQIEAMDYFDTVAERSDIHMEMDFEPGDIQIVNNHFLVHSRTRYDDSSEWDNKRHLMRLWLACQDGPPFPPAMSENFQGLTENGRPNGIHVSGVPFVAPLDAS